MKCVKCGAPIKEGILKGLRLDLCTNCLIAQRELVAARDQTPSGNVVVRVVLRLAFSLVIALFAGSAWQHIWDRPANAALRATVAPSDAQWYALVVFIGALAVVYFLLHQQLRPAQIIELGSKLLACTFLMMAIVEANDWLVEKTLSSADLGTSLLGWGFLAAISGVIWWLAHRRIVQAPDILPG